MASGQNGLRWWIQLILAVLALHQLAVLQPVPMIVSAAGVSYTFTGLVDLSWENSTNWTPEGVPGSSDNATISGFSVHARTAINVFGLTLQTAGTFTPALLGLTIGSGGLTVSDQSIGHLNLSLITSGSVAVNGATFIAGGGELRVYPVRVTLSFREIRQIPDTAGEARLSVNAIAPLTLSSLGDISVPNLLIQSRGDEHAHAHAQCWCCGVGSCR